MIEFQNVIKSFGGPAVLQDISLTVPTGELVILIGPSGCGKSTLLRLVNRLLEPTSGDIRVGGVSVLEQDPVALRRRLGYVIQSVGLFPHLTVQENVELVPSISGVGRETRAARALELLSLMGLEPGQYAGHCPRPCRRPRIPADGRTVLGARPHHPRPLAGAVSDAET